MKRFFFVLNKYITLIAFTVFFQTVVYAQNLPIIEDSILPQATLPTIDSNQNLPITSTPEIEASTNQRHQILIYPITYANFPQATIKNVHNIEGSFSFAIHASSPVSYVNYFTLENRLVIDIYNAVPTEDATFPGIPPFIDSIRVAKQNGFTRVVFDITQIPDYTIGFNYDRSIIYLKFAVNPINNITFFSSAYNDYISITGEILPIFEIVQNLQYSLTVTLPLATLAENIYGEEGNFFTSIQAYQRSLSNVHITAVLVGDITYNYLINGNTLTIIIGPPTYKNISFDRESSTITLYNNENITIATQNITIYHNYRDLRHVFTLDGDYSHHFGYGTIQFYSAYSTIIKIVTNYGITQIIIYGENIALAQLLYDESEAYNLIIRTFSPKEVYNYIVMLDPGHGGSDPGAIHFGLRESDQVLKISNLVYDMLLENENIGVFATRNTDVFVSLEDRANLSNGVVDLFVSIHMNAFTNPNPHGTETYYLPQQNEYIFNITRREVATIFQNNLLADLGTVDRGVRSANFTVLRLTEMPSVLLEIGFLSNPTEAQMLGDPVMLQVMANSIYRSILEIFEIYTPIR